MRMWWCTEKDLSWGCDKADHHFHMWCVTMCVHMDCLNVHLYLLFKDAFQTEISHTHSHVCRHEHTHGFQLLSNWSSVTHLALRFLWCVPYFFFNQLHMNSLSHSTRCCQRVQHTLCRLWGELLPTPKFQISAPVHSAFSSDCVPTHIVGLWY